METEEFGPNIEKEPESQVVGILLTAGSVEKAKGRYRRLEPDLEGKIRALGALDDLAHRAIDRLFVVGGATSHGRPLSEIYKNYLRRFLERYHLTEDQIEDLPGEIETAGDLLTGVSKLAELGLDENIRIYSSGFHLQRAYDVMSQLGYEVVVVPTEKLTKERSHRHPPIVDKVLNPDFLMRMKAREERIRKTLSLNRLPAVGKLKPGFALAEFLVRKRKGR